MIAVSLISTILLLVLASRSSAESYLTVYDRGCILAPTPICAGDEPLRIYHKGTLMIGFPHFLIVESARPVCILDYEFNSGWRNVIFDVYNWCLLGENDETVACCERKNPYTGPNIYANPYLIKQKNTEEHSLDPGAHSVGWDDAFPDYLRRYHTNLDPKSVPDYLKSDASQLPGDPSQHDSNILSTSENDFKPALGEQPSVEVSDAQYPNQASDEYGASAIPLEEVYEVPIY